MKSTIDRAGRVVVPKAIRELAGLRAGAKLEIEYRNGRVELEPVQAPTKLARKGSFWVLDAPGLPALTQRQVREVTQHIRNNRTRRRP